MYNEHTNEKQENSMLTMLCFQMKFSMIN